MNFHAAPSVDVARAGLIYRRSLAPLVAGFLAIRVNLKANHYPKKHKKEALEMQANGGLLTEFWSNTNPDRENFVKRNRIVAGLSEATIVIESATKGGSLITAATMRTKCQPIKSRF